MTFTSTSSAQAHHRPPPATASSGLTPVITLDNSVTGCTLTAGVVHFTATGTCVIDLNQAGNANYNAASPLKQSSPSA